MGEDQKTSEIQEDQKIWSFVVNTGKGDEFEEFLERNMGHARCLLSG